MDIIYNKQTGIKNQKIKTSFPNLMKLNAAQLRNLEEDHEIVQIQRQPVYLIVDNVYDTYNIGGLFRLSDALAIEKIYLCGQTETPPNHKIKKASIGTYKIVPWEYKKTTLEAIEDLRKEVPTISIYAIEQSDSSIPYDSIKPQIPVAFIVSNETTGASEEVLKAADTILEIPMYGINTSLNVIVSAAIVMYNHQSSLRIRSDIPIKETPNKE
jgi:tRNA G18 (ribose-2'-O)-methylase SpoU